MAMQFIFTMKGLRKVYPPDKQVLQGIWLSFLPGAKIGVIGPNGAGKSTLLRIMAGVETPSQGEAFAAEGATVGYLRRSRSSTREDRAGQRRGGRRRDAALLTRFDEISASFGEDFARRDGQAARRAGAGPGPIDATGGWELDRASSSRWTRCACRRPTPT